MENKKSLAAFLLLIIAAFTLNSVAFADDDPALKEIEAVYKKMDELIVKKDVKALNSYLADDYTFALNGKNLKRDEVIAQTEQNFSMVKEVTSAVSKLEKIQKVEGSYVVDVNFTLKGKVAGQDGQDHELVVVAKSRDKWTKTKDGSWKTNSGEDLGQTITIDGQKIQ